MGGASYPPQNGTLSPASVLTIADKFAANILQRIYLRNATKHLEVSKPEETASNVAFPVMLKVGKRNELINQLLTITVAYRNYDGCIPEYASSIPELRR
ncbi:hypothetical protein EZS27_036935 [termite gut metagenome]|uniref:Uncharacterized protein n=1 Tax=termite gut metagenome TaxID=433724 RepID=A0A5J4PTG7_9ZZZZ